MGSKCASSDQEKIWCDKQIMLDWISQQGNSSFINRPTNGSSGRILIVDVHRAQQIDKGKSQSTYHQDVPVKSSHQMLYFANT